jgi:cell division protein FtsN
VVIRMRLKGLLAGYSYDLPSTRYGGSTGGTHEIQVKFQFGNIVERLQTVAKNDTVPSVLDGEAERKPKVQLAQTQEPQQTEVEKGSAEKTFQTVKASENPPEQRKAESPENDLPDTSETRKSDIPDEAYPRNITYQLVVGAYVRKVHADRYVRKLLSEGVISRVINGKSSTLYYVTVPSYATKAISLDRILEIRNRTQFKDAWFQAFD